MLTHPPPLANQTVSSLLQVSMAVPFGQISHKAKTGLGQERDAVHSSCAQARQLLTLTADDVTITHLL
jgi:hypothetical protein